MLQPTSDPESISIDTAVGPIAITREGDPAHPPLLCVHGIPGSLRDFRYLAPRLRDRFFVVRMDMPGFGSTPIGSAASVAGWADVVAAVADALGLSRYALVAHSFGASVALNLAHRHGERVTGLVLLAGPGARMHRGYGAPHAAFWLLAQLTAAPMLRLPMVAFVRRQFARRGLNAPDNWRQVHNMVRVVASLRFEPLGRWASELGCPVILAHSDDDALVEVDIAREQAGRIRDCECLFWLEGGHHIQKTHAADIAEAVIHRFA